MSDLDDFFAKKDRKKSKGKKFATADEIAKKLEENGKKNEKPKKEKLPSSNPQDPEERGSLNHEEDEWKEFEEEKKDYTGLKIQNLQINEFDGDGDDDDGDDEDILEENEAGELVPRKKTASGPWKMIKQPENVEPKIKEEKVEKPEPSSSTSSSYVPPQRRNQLLQRETYQTSLRVKTKGAPDINNEEFFPTLSASKTMEPVGPWGRKKRDTEGTFEEVKNSKSHSSRYSDISTKSAPKLTLENKYTALNNDQS